MTQSKSTKRALTASMISLLLCIAMLIGTTFAWFTDTVTTGKNKIVAGNLDVELYVKDADSNSYVAVDETTSLFDESALWEPGYTQAVYLKVANVGALALKYQLAVNVISEQKGTNVAGEEFSLSDYLVFGQAVNAAEVTYATREEAWAAAGNTQGLNDYSGEGHLKAGEEGFVALVVYMPTSVGNEANHKTNTTPPSIDLGITLIATQDAVERDSFNNEYDKGAAYPGHVATEAEFKTLLSDVKDGDTIYFDEDIDIKYTGTYGSGAHASTYNTYVVAPNVTIDLKGHTLNVTNNGYAFALASSGITLKNGTINIANAGASYPLYVTSGAKNVVIENVTINGGMQVVGNSQATLKNVSITAANYYDVYLEYNSTVTVESGNFTSNGTHPHFYTAFSTDTVILNGGIFSGGIPTHTGNGTVINNIN